MSLRLCWLTAEKLRSCRCRGGARPGAWRPRKEPTVRVRLTRSEAEKLPHYRDVIALIEKFRSQSSTSDAEVWGKFNEFSAKVDELLECLDLNR